MTQVEYAGFRYTIAVEGGRLIAIPAPGQHHAAAKEKHRRAALDQYRRLRGIIGCPACGTPVGYVGEPHPCTV